MQVERTPQARWLALVTITVIALYLCWQMLQPFVDVLVWAVVLVIVFHPAHRWVAMRTGRPGLSAGLSVLLVMVTVIGPVAFVVTAIARELGGLASSAQDSVAGLVASPEHDPRVQAVLGYVGRYVDLDQVLSPDNIRNMATSVSQRIVQGTVGVVGGALGFLVKTFFVLFTMFYLFRDAEPAVGRLADMLPLDEARSRALLARTRDVISASVNGVIVIALIQGTLGGVMFAMLGLPSALLWGVIMTLLSMIPMVGAGLVWAPAAVLLLVTGHWIKAIVLVAWGALVIGMVDNLLRPRLVGDRTQLHPLVIFFSVLGGLQVFGVLGILLGPVVLAITLALLAVFREAQPPSGAASTAA